VAKGRKSKTLFTTKSTSIKRDVMSAEFAKLSERRWIPSDFFPSTAGLTIYRDRVAIGVFTGSIGGVIIESEAIADMLRHLFDLAWLSAEQFSKTSVLQPKTEKMAVRA
jgi:hypothetical protein